MPTDLDPAAAAPARAHEAADDAAGEASGVIDASGGLDDRVCAAEELPLADRADAFSALHDELRTRLETGGAGA